MISLQNQQHYIKMPDDIIHHRQGRQESACAVGQSRCGGNTDLLCDEFVKGATEAGGDVEKIFLDDYRIDFFFTKSTLSPPDTVLTEGDQAPMLVQKMADADIIVLSSPVYYMNIDGQLKTLMDRCYRNKGLEGKEFYYITACADPDEATAETAIYAFRGFVVCLPPPPNAEA